jgi:hypothetical protein
MDKFNRMCFDVMLAITTSMTIHPEEVIMNTGEIRLIEMIELYLQHAMPHYAGSLGRGILVEQTDGGAKFCMDMYRLGSKSIEHADPVWLMTMTTISELRMVEMNSAYLREEIMLPFKEFFQNIGFTVIER